MRPGLFGAGDPMVLEPWNIVKKGSTVSERLTSYLVLAPERGASRPGTEPPLLEQGPSDRNLGLTAALYCTSNRSTIKNACTSQGTLFNIL